MLDYDNYIVYHPQIQKLIKLSLFDAFLYETKEFGRKKYRSVSPTEILSIKVIDYSG